MSQTYVFPSENLHSRKLAKSQQTSKTLEEMHKRSLKKPLKLGSKIVPKSDSNLYSQKIDQNNFLFENGSQEGPQNLPKLNENDTKTLCL